ncbi:MAG: phytanoyl-CoA dioxygenase family protein, partial [Candidatus Sericytochromatia bacterium]
MASPAPRPDFNAGFFSLERLRPLLASEGVVLLRRLLPPGLLAPWAQVFATAWQKTEERHDSGTMSEAEQLNYYRFGHPVPALIEGFDLWINSLFAQLPLRNLLRTLYGPEVFIMGSYSLARIQHPELPVRALPFHQDYEYIGAVKQAINVWIPLTPAGGDYPGLEVQVGRPDPQVLWLGQPESERRAILDRLPSSSFWQPQLQPGDVLIFTPYTLHRTSLLPGMQHTRISYELRICPEADRAHTLSSLHARG